MESWSARLSGSGGVLAGIGALAALVVLPLPLWARVALVAAVGGVALVAIAGASEADALTAVPDHDLTDHKVVKVARDSREVTLAELHAGRFVVERPLPLAWADAEEEARAQDGEWRAEPARLRIAVGDQDLVVSPTEPGIWEGTARQDGRDEDFIAAVLDPRPVRNGAAWVGIKLAHGGARRIVVATSDGRLREHDPFDSHLSRKGRWHVDEDARLHLVVDRRYLVVRRWGDFHLGVETGDGPEEGFAVVRAALVR